MKENRRSILLFPLINLFYWSAIYLYTPTLSTYAVANGASDQMVGIIIGSYGLAQMIFRLPFGILSDRLRRRKVFVNIGMLGVGLGGLIAGLLPSSGGLLAARAMTGFGASSWVTTTVLFSSYYPPDKTDQAVSLLNAYCSLATALAMFLGGWFVQLWGQEVTSLLAFGCGVAAFLLTLGIADHRPEPTHPLNAADVKYVLTDRNLWHFAILALIFQFVWQGTVSCFTPILAQRFGVTSSQLGSMTAVGNLGHLIASAVIGIYLLPKLPSKWTFGVGYALEALIVIATAFSPSYSIMLTLQFFNGVVGYSLFLCGVTHCVKEMPDAYRGIAVGMSQAIYGGGMFLGPACMGQLLNWMTLEQSYLAVGGLCFVAAICGYRWAAAQK